MIRISANALRYLRVHKMFKAPFYCMDRMEMVFSAETSTSVMRIFIGQLLSTENLLKTFKYHYSNHPDIRKKRRLKYLINVHIRFLTYKSLSDLKWP